MKRNIATISAFVAVFSITTLPVVAAQSSYPQADKQKPAAQADKEKPATAKHTMTGCLEKGADATMFRLTNIEESGPKTVELHDDAGTKLAAHVGHKIAVTGTEIDPQTLKKGTTGKTEPAPAATPGAKEHHMRVDSLKMISATCK